MITTLLLWQLAGILLCQLSLPVLSKLDSNFLNSDSCKELYQYYFDKKTLINILSWVPILNVFIGIKTIISILVHTIKKLVSKVKRQNK